MKYVYMLRVGERHYKVGVAKNVTKRIAQLQTSNPNKIEVVTSRLVDNAYDIELELHHLNKPFAAGGGTEWFDLEIDAAMQLAIDINKYPELDLSEEINVRTLISKLSTDQKVIQDQLSVITSRYQKLLDLDIAIKQEERDYKKRQRVLKDAQSSKPDEKIMIEKARHAFIKEGRVSTSLLQRKLEIGYGKAARLLDKLEVEGFVKRSANNGWEFTNPRIH